MLKQVMQLKKVDCTLSGRQILHSVSLRVLEQEMIVLIGANGSGKTSLLKLIARRHSVSNGEIMLHNQSVDSIHPTRYAKDVILLSQTPEHNLCLGMTIQEHVDLYLNGKKNQELERYGLSSYLDQYNEKLKFHIDSPIDGLSGGEKQCLVLALVFLCQPKLLLLDEHTAALDPHARDDVMRVTYQHIRRKNIACIMTTHHLEHVRHYGDRVIALKDGRVLASLRRRDSESVALDDILQDCYM